MASPAITTSRYREKWPRSRYLPLVIVKRGLAADNIQEEDGGVVSAGNIIRRGIAVSTFPDDVTRRGIMVGGFVSDVISRQVGGHSFLRGWLCVLVLKFLADGASFCVAVRI